MTPRPAHRQWLVEVKDSQTRAERQRDRQAMHAVYVRRRLTALAVIALVAFAAGVLVGLLA
jgi:hypothetical protein